MSAARLLQNEARCACCGELMKAGEPFRWHLRAGRQVTKYAATKDRYRPAHVNEACYWGRFEAEEKAAKRAAEEQARAMIAKLDLVDCPQCNGSGFSGYGTGYDAVCDHCGGQQQMPAEPLSANAVPEEPHPSKTGEIP